MYKLGCHLSTSNGLEKMGEVAVSINANTFQFFTRNPRGGAAKALNQNDIKGLTELLIKHKFGDILVHSPYTLNMASSKPKTREFAKMIFKDDLERMKKLPCTLYNFHPGSHTGLGVDEGVKHISNIINECVTEDIDTWILIETMSGKGTEIGCTFEEIQLIIDQVNYPEKMGVCLDTCHLFSAGYDIVNDLEGVLEKFNKIIGINKIKAIHLNDSMYPLNSRKDRHAGIGEGKIGFEALIQFLQHPLLKEIPFILETPYDTDGHKREIKMLREIIE